MVVNSAHGGGGSSIHVHKVLRGLEAKIKRQILKTSFAETKMTITSRSGMTGRE